MRWHLLLGHFQFKPPTFALPSTLPYYFTYVSFLQLKISLLAPSPRSQQPWHPPLPPYLFIYFILVINFLWLYDTWIVGRGSENGRRTFYNRVTWQRKRSLSNFYGTILRGREDMCLRRFDYFGWFRWEGEISRRFILLKKSIYASFQHFCAF